MVEEMYAVFVIVTVLGFSYTVINQLLPLLSFRTHFIFHSRISLSGINFILLHLLRHSVVQLYHISVALENLSVSLGASAVMS